MSKINYTRVKEKKWKMPVRHPMKVDRVIDPEGIYDRTDAKKEIEDGLEEYYEDSTKKES